jgi:4'-phosphopantetheinyl transferase EntD
MIEKILPAGVSCAEARADVVGAVLLPAEAAMVATALDERRREFTTGRACARTALSGLGLPDVPILADAHGAPRWPAGVVGSITHCAGYRCAAVARTTDIRAIGVDAEPNEQLPGDVLDAICGADERARLQGLAAGLPGICWDRLLFSAKESVYKAWYPVTGRRIGFEDADVTISALDGRFCARLRPAASAGRDPLTALTGRWRVCGGLILTAIAEPAGRGYGATASSIPMRDDRLVSETLGH